MLESFRSLDWRTQIAIVLAFPVTVGGGTTAVSQLWKPDSAVAQIQTVVTDTNTKVTTLNQTVEALNTTMGRAVDLTILRLCENESDEEWMASLGDEGTRYCRAVRNKVLSDVIRDVWSSR